jgi:hypothetical protein
MSMAVPPPGPLIWTPRWSIVPSELPRRHLCFCAYPRNKREWRGYYRRLRFGLLCRMDRGFVRTTAVFPTPSAPASKQVELKTMALFNVGFVIFPELTQLDFTLPQQVLARLPESAMHIIAKTSAPVLSDSASV